MINSVTMTTSPKISLARPSGVGTSLGTGSGLRSSSVSSQCCIQQIKYQAWMLRLASQGYNHQVWFKLTLFSSMRFFIASRAFFLKYSFFSSGVILALNRQCNEYIVQVPLKFCTNALQYCYKQPLLHCYLWALYSVTTVTGSVLCNSCCLTLFSSLPASASSSVWVPRAPGAGVSPEPVSVPWHTVQLAGRPVASCCQPWLSVIYTRWQHISRQKSSYRAAGVFN